MSYHLVEIKKGVLGEVSKITEEYEEFLDAVNQKNNIMILLELSDMLGAIDLFIKKYNMKLEDLIVMHKATKRAFESGHRK